jgi:ElaB/YqjD/DUF883 family membrane-anchored ribosome-binding protein
MGNASEVQEKAQEAAGQAQEKVQEVAGEAQEKAREAAGQAQEGLRQQVDQRSTQAGERVSGTAQDLRSVGEELRKQGKDTPAKLADRAAEQTEKVGSYLTDNDAERILRDAEDFGRQRPWAVLAGGIAAGVLAARFLKASSRSRYQQRTGAPDSGPRPAGRVQAPAPDRYPAQPLATPGAVPQPAAMPSSPGVGP